MSAQREREAVESSHRSIVPNIPGVPWWGAVLIAVASTAIGYMIDAGGKELTHTFAGLYIFGCVAAVLAVRQAAVFTAVIQPPLILFCTVPGAYWLFHGAKVDKFKDLLINCGYPLIERFPLMLGTAGGVLLIGLFRWYFGKNTKAATASGSAAGDAEPAERQPLLSGILAKLTSLFAADDEVSGPPAHGRAARTNRTSRSGARSTSRRTDSRTDSRTAGRAEDPARSRSRHARPDARPEDGYEPGGERPRRRSAVPPEYADYDPAAAQRPRRRRPPGDSDLDSTPSRDAAPPREMRREPHPRRNPYERPSDRQEPRSGRANPYETYDRPKQADAGERRSRHERRAPGYEPRKPYDPSFEPGYEPRSEPRSRRAAPPGSTGANPNHHPISPVRYRGQPPRQEPRERDERRDEPRSDRRNRPRAQRRPQTESWEYDA